MQPPVNFQTSGKSFNFVEQSKARMSRDFVPPKLYILDTTALEAHIRQWRKSWAILDEILGDTNKKVPDIYEEVASRMFDIPLEEVTPVMRKKAKVTLLGAMYS